MKSLAGTSLLMMESYLDFIGEFEQQKIAFFVYCCQLDR